MALVSYVDIVPGLELSYWRALTPQDRFQFARITKKISLLSKKKKKGISQKSLLPQVAALWNALSDSVKNDWKLAGAKCNLTGYRLFVQDQCIRIINEFPGLAVPVLLHQSWIGQLHIESPASELKITQIHPKFYWVYRKVTAKKAMYEPILVNESFVLPLKIKLNYSADLSPIAGNPAIYGDAIYGDVFYGDEAGGGDSFAKFYAEVWSLYQGRDILTTLEIPLDLVCDWKSAEITLSSVVGLPIRYDLFFHLSGLRGDLFIDNIKAEHSAQNWARDPFCKDVNQGFTKAFYQIPKHWAGVILPLGSWFESNYKDF